MLVGRSDAPISNLVTNLPDLGLDIVEGTLSITHSFESHPTGSISIVGLQKRDIGLYRKHFSQIGRPFNIYGLDLEISSYAETSSVLEGSDIPYPIESFDIQVQLQGINQEKVSCPILVRKGSSRSISLAGTISLANLARLEGLVYEGYDRTISIPSGSSGDLTYTFDNEVRQNLRINKKVIDYSSKTIRARDWLACNVWSFNRPQILDSVTGTLN